MVKFLRSAKTGSWSEQISLTRGSNILLERVTGAVLAGICLAGTGQRKALAMKKEAVKQ